MGFSRARMALPIIIAILFARNIGAVDEKFAVDPINPIKKPFAEAKTFAQSGQYQKSLSLLGKLNDDRLKSGDLSLKYFSMGVWAQELQRYSEAIEYFNKSINSDDELTVYNNYHLGLAYKSLRDWDKAKKYLSLAQTKKGPRNIQLQTRFDLSDVAFQTGKWRTAYNHLKYLERRWRYGEKYPDVLWRLLKVEQKRKRKRQVCRWAKKLYTRYPSHPLVYDWSVDLQENKVEGKKLGCLASEEDLRNRFQRFQWAGESKRAKEEIALLKLRAEGDEAKMIVDEIEAFFLYRDGFPKEGLQLIIQHYEKRKKNFDYLQLLAKIASRAGEYPTAVGAYYNSHRLKPKSRKGRRALFHAAFLSYQFQDYDGASRKFEQFVDNYPRSGLAKDSLWHLAWIKYLKGDYEGAVISFKNILHKKKKRRRAWRKYQTEKIKYWLAMSYLKLKEHDSAAQIFSELASNKLLDYYSVVAKERLKTLPGDVRKPASIKVDEEESIGGEDEVAAKSLEENESEDALAEMEDDEKNEEAVADEDEPLPEKFKNPRLKKNFERAQNFIRVGFKDKALWEYYEIERRTTNRDYLKLLMSAYQKIGFHHRTAYIGEIYFSTPRKRHGTDGVRYLWEYTYPQAFREPVFKYSSDFSVPKEFVWSIMRAESRYRPTIVSPVGAIGLMQIMPATGDRVAKLLGESTFQTRLLREPETNVKLGTRYLHRLLKKFEGNLSLAAAGYNAGPHRVDTWLSKFGGLDGDEFIEHIPFIETRNYVKKVVRYFGVYSQLYAEKKPSLAWLSQSVPVRIDTSQFHRESWEDL